MTTNLTEEHRSKLDGIVQQMISNKESEENIQWVVDDFKGKYSTQITDTEKEAQPEEKGLGGRLVERFEKAIPPVKSAVDIATLPQRTQFRAGGQTIGALFDIIGEGAGLAYKHVVPDVTKKRISHAVTKYFSRPEGKILKNLIGSGQEGWQSFKETHPEVATDLESVGNIAAVLPINKATMTIKQGLSTASKTLAKKVAKAKDFDVKILQAVKKRMPAIVKKGQIKGSIDKFDKRSVNAVKEVIDIKDQLNYIDEAGDIVNAGIPKNTEQGLSAFTQTKDAIYNRYNTAKNLAEGTGADISTMPIVRGLRQLKRKTFIQRDKNLLRQVDDEINYFLKEKSRMTLTEVQEELANINAKTRAYQVNPQPNLLNAQAMDIIVADKMRSSMDDVITRATGTQYASLKKSYGAVKDIEHSYVEAVKRNRVKAPGISLDLSDILTGGTAIYAWSNMNMGLIGATTFAKGIKQWHKWRIGTDHMTKVMFKQADDLMTQKKLLGLPEEIITKAPTPKRIGYTPILPSSLKSGRVEAPTTIPPLTRPTTKALPAPEYLKGGQRVPSVINLKMTDLSGIPKPSQYTPKEWGRIKTLITRKVSEPDFLRKNPDVYNMVAKLKAKGAIGKIPKQDIDKLIYRIQRDLPETYDPSLRKGLISRKPLLRE